MDGSQAPEAGHSADHPTSMPGGRYICGMRIVVDFDLCESNALCMAAAPEVFEVRDDDFLYVLQEEPPEELREKVRGRGQGLPESGHHGHRLNDRAAR